MPIYDVEWAVCDIKERAPHIFLYRDYYDGNHRFPFATDSWNKEFANMFKYFRDNLCPAVVDAKADRLILNAIDGGTDAVNGVISSIWTRERLEYRSGEIHKMSLKEGDAFVIVWPDETNQARWYVQRGDRVAAKYGEDPQGELEIAAKLWPVEDVWHKNKEKWYFRLNLYYRDHIERYITMNEVAGVDVPETPDKWQEFQEPDPDEEGAIITGSVVENPYGIVPVIPFPNNADLGAYGRSELTDIIPLQDALNKSVSNMLIAGEFVAFPQRYIIGLEVDVNEEGIPTNREQRAAMDRILTIGNPAAKAGEFAAADLTKFVAEQDSYRAEMARVSRTPLHHLLLTGDFPSGEALGAAERPLMSQIKDRQAALGTSYQQAMALSLTIERTAYDPAALNATWEDTAWKSAEASAEELRLKKELGVPDSQLWREMGYDDAQIEQFTLEKEERMATMQASFDAGIGGVNPETVATPALRAVTGSE